MFIGGATILMLIRVTMDAMDNSLPVQVSADLQGYL
jgi:hypothetical protein